MGVGAEQGGGGEHRTIQHLSLCFFCFLAPDTWSSLGGKSLHLGCSLRMLLFSFAHSSWLSVVPAAQLKETRYNTTPPPKNTLPHHFFFLLLSPVKRLRHECWCVCRVRNYRVLLKVWSRSKAGSVETRWKQHAFPFLQCKVFGQHRFALSTSWKFLYVPKGLASWPAPDIALVWLIDDLRKIFRSYVHSLLSHFCSLTFSNLYWGSFWDKETKMVISCICCERY